MLSTPVAVFAFTTLPASAVPELTVTTPTGGLLDFGEVERGTQVALPITIQNTGDEPLQLNNWRLDGPFDLANPPDLTPVSPEGTREFQVEFAAVTDGATAGSFVLDYTAIFQGQLIVELRAFGGAQPTTTTTTVIVTATTVDNDLAMTGSHDYAALPIAMLLVLAGSLVLATHPRRFRRP